MTMLEDVTQRILAAAKAAGADTADALAIQGTSLAVDVRTGALEMAERSESIDIGLRVLLGQKQACVSASNVSDATLETLAARAVAMAREAPEDPYAGLAEASELATSWDVHALELADPSDEPSAQDLQSDALDAEAAAHAVDGVTQVQSASASYAQRHIFMAATNGHSGGYARTTRSTSCVAIAGTGLGMERDYDGDSRTFQNDLRAASEIGQSAGLRAVERLNPQRPPTGSFPVLFDERVSSTLVGHILAACNGSAIARGGSWLREKLDARILPAGMDLVEDPHRPRISASRPFDAEGLPTKTRKIVDDGVLTGWTLDLSSARKLGMTPTGNATRSLTAPPSPTNWNISLTQGTAARDTLIQDMGTGLLVTGMIGATINANTGDYSRGAYGFWIENGQIAYPVNECTIASNLLTMLGTLIPANDARPWLSRVVPSLLIETMAIAGE